jgi:hypothetical protein
MNRHERRAATSADKGFGGYRAQARRASPDVSDRELGEAWMRGQAWSASGAEGMAVHEKGEPSRARRDDDVLVSMSYGSGLHFKAWIAPDLLRVSVAQLGRVLDEALKPGLDRRGMSRCFILDRLVKQHYDGDTRSPTSPTTAAGADKISAWSWATHEPLPDLVHVMPPHPINETAEVRSLLPIEED